MNPTLPWVNGVLEQEYNGQPNAEVLCNISEFFYYKLIEYISIHGTSLT